MRLPVYVIHWNAPERCADTVASILDSEGVDVALTLIDNASDRLPDVPSRVGVDRQPLNIGYAGAANRALALATFEGAEFFAITSHDIEVAPDALRRCLEFAVAHPAYGILGLEGGGANDGSDGWISGSFMLFRAACVAEVGDFDVLFGSYCEDVDYCHRAVAAGWKLGVPPDARASTRGTFHPERARLLMNANFTVLAAKEGDWRRVLRRLGGMLRRSVTEPGQGWPRAFALSCSQLLRLLLRRFPRARP
jgi:GT2 family glycosyltransferase